MASSESSQELVPVHCWWRSLFLVGGRKHASLSTFLLLQNYTRTWNLFLQCPRLIMISQSRAAYVYEVCGSGCLRKREREWEVLKGGEKERNSSVYATAYTHWGQRIILWHWFSLSTFTWACYLSDWEGLLLLSLTTLFFGHGGLEFFTSFFS